MQKELALKIYKAFEESLVYAPKEKRPFLKVFLTKNVTCVEIEESPTLSAHDKVALAICADGLTRLFTQYLKTLLTTQTARDYFPDMTIVLGSKGAIALESNDYRLQQHIDKGSFLLSFMILSFALNVVQPGDMKEWMSRGSYTVKAADPISAAIMLTALMSPHDFEDMWSGKSAPPAVFLCHDSDIITQGIQSLRDHSQL